VYFKEHPAKDALFVWVNCFKERYLLMLQMELLAILLLNVLRMKCDLFLCSPVKSCLDIVFGLIVSQIALKCEF